MAVIGSTTVYELGWLVLGVIPMRAIIQSIAAQVGAVSKAVSKKVSRIAYVFATGAAWRCWRSPTSGGCCRWAR